MPLKSESLVDDGFLGEPFGLAVTGDTIVVVDAAGAPYLQYFSTESGARLVSFGTRGEGPGDFGGFPSIVAGAGAAGGVWLHETVLDRVTNMGPVDRSDGTKRIGLLQLWNLDSVYPSNVYWRARDTLLGVMVSPNADGLRIVETTGGGRTSRVAHRIDLGDDRFAAHDLLGAYGFAMCGSPDGRHLAMVYLYAGRIDLFDTSTWRTSQAEVPFKFLPPVYRHPVTGSASFLPGGPATRRAYRGCAATNERVFAVFSGRIGRMRRSDMQPPHMFIHVLDWGGALVGVLRLDHAASSIAVDPKGSWMYSTVSLDSLNGPSVRRSRLPDDLRLLGTERR